MWNEVVVDGVVVLQWLLLLPLLLLHPAQAIYEMSDEDKQSVKEQWEFLKSEFEDKDDKSQLKLHQMIVAQLLIDPRSNSLKKLCNGLKYGPTPFKFPEFPTVLTPEEQEQRVQRIQSKLDALPVTTNHQQHISDEEQPNHQRVDGPVPQQNPLPTEILGSLERAVKDLTTRVNELTKNEMLSVVRGRRKQKIVVKEEGPVMTVSVVRKALEASKNNKQSIETLFSQNIKLFSLMHDEPTLDTRKKLQSIVMQVVQMIQDLLFQNYKLLDRLKN